MNKTALNLFYEFSRRLVPHRFDSKTSTYLIVVFDLETGGLHAEHHDIVEIGAECFHTIPGFARPSFSTMVMYTSRDRLTEGSIKQHKITHRMLEEQKAPTPKQALSSFFLWLESAKKAARATGVILCSYSGGHFDSKFTVQHSDKEGVPVPSWVLFADYRKVMPPGYTNNLPNQKLRTLCERAVGAPINEEAAHNALTDVRMLSIVMRMAEIEHINESLERRLYQEATCDWTRHVVFTASRHYHSSFPGVQDPPGADRVGKRAADDFLWGMDRPHPDDHQGSGPTPVQGPPGSDAALD